MRKISIDAGCGYIKTVAFDDNHQLIKNATPAIAVTGKPITQMDGTKGASYFCDGQQWSMNKTSSNFKDTRFPDYPYDQHNTVLMHHGIKEAGINNDEIELATCIPLGDYFKDMDLNKARKRDAVQKVVTSLDGIALPKINHKVTVPEGLAGWIDMCFNINGEKKPNMPTGDVGLVDLGARTLDMALVRGLDIYSDSIKTVPLGYLDVMETLNNLVNEKYRDTDRFAVSDLEKALTNKTLEIESGRIEDVTILVNQAISIFSDSVFREISLILGNTGQLSGTCYFGGGVYHIEKIIRGREKVFIPEDPQFCNAIGALKAFRI